MACCNLFAVVTVQTSCIQRVDIGNCALCLLFSRLRLTDNFCNCIVLQGAAAAMYQQYQQAALNGYPDLSDQDFMMDDDTADLTPRSGRVV